MKKLLLLSLISSAAFGECNLANDIKKNADGTFTYTRECHLLMGDWRKDLDQADQDIQKLQKAIELKDLVINDLSQSRKLWMDTSFDLERRLNATEKLQTTDRWVHFGLGIATTVLSVWAAGQLRR